jgi:hypothetical protein
MIPGFRRLRRGEMCPVCGHREWCAVSIDGTKCLCQRMPSPKRWRDAGWFHVIDPINRPDRVERERRDERPATLDCAGILRRCTVDTTTVRLAAFADKLGVSVKGLRRLGAAWYERKQAWAFPMRDGAGAVVGIRLRTDDGMKFAVAGSHQGLFVPMDLATDGWLCLCEGPTSCCALLDLGFAAVGRPSCQGGSAFVLDMLRGNRRDVTVFGDHDPAKARPDGSVFYPGQDGARKLATEISGACRSVKVVIPPFCKDVRDWKRSGADHGTVLAAIAAANYWREP